ncbi:MAG: hypothetical protein IPG89_15865 [Bacteroidetes bacterium]|nr:hypothetical protein [Bacteroidota bacterium]
MKKNIAIITIAFLSLFYSQNLTSAKLESKVNTQLLYLIEDEITLKLGDNYGTKVVLVSFNGIDDYIGELTITDKNNRVVQYVEVFEIVSSPNHSTINVSEFASGEYTFVLKTKIRSYSSKITIQ